jgi:hypothetical protein
LQFAPTSTAPVCHHIPYAYNGARHEIQTASRCKQPFNMPATRTESLSSDDRRAIEVFAISATHLVIEELLQVRTLCAQILENTTHPSVEDREMSIRTVLKQFFGRDPLQKLQQKKKIYLNIVDCIGKPPAYIVIAVLFRLTLQIDNSRDTKQFFRSDNTELVPHRLHQRSHEIPLKEAKPEFAQRFCNVLQENVKLAIELQSQDVMRIFERQWQMYAERTGAARNAECCVLRLLEDDYHTPHCRHTETQLVVYFGIDCPTCGGWHEVKVYR